MNVGYGAGQSEHGPGVQIELSGNEVAIAIDAYLEARRIHVSGPRTIRVNGERLESGSVYVDPLGFVVDRNTDVKFSGRGPEAKDDNQDDRSL
jgi:hypothetical protein